MPAFTRVVVFDEKLYHGNGLVKAWTHKISSKFSRESKRYVKSRTGQLKKSIRMSIRNPGPKMCQGTIGTNAPHALYVLRGTGFPVRGSGGRIYTRRGFARARRGNPAAEKKFYDTKFRDRQVKLGRPLAGTLLSVGKQHLYPPIRRMESVAGQEANNFFEKGWRATARNHSSIRGIPFPLSYD